MMDMLHKGFSVTAAVAAAIAPSFSLDFTIDYIGVPFNAVVAAALGAYSGFAFGDKVEPRGRVFQLFIACVLMGCAWTGLTAWLIDVLTDWELKRGAMAWMAAIISCLTRFFIPEIIKRIGPWLDKIPFFKLKTPKDGEES